MRATHRTAPQRGADDPRPFDQQLAEVEFRLHTALHADDNQLSVSGQGVDIPVQIGGTHDVEDHIGAVGIFLESRDEVLVVIVDGDLGSQVATGLQLLGRPGSDSHPGAQRARDLDRVGADAAGPAVHQQQLTLAQVSGQHQVRPHRAGNLG